MTARALRRLTMWMMTVTIFVFAMGAIAAPPAKKPQHHNSGHALIADKLKTPGTYQIDRKGKHTVSADVKGGKISGFHVKHDTKGDIPVKKYKSKNKVASLDLPEGSMPAQTEVVWYIAYGYWDEDAAIEEYYWFPYDDIYDGDAGAVEYVAY
jgi:hypothetical protein